MNKTFAIWDCNEQAWFVDKYNWTRHTNNAFWFATLLDAQDAINQMKLGDYQIFQLVS